MGRDGSVCTEENSHAWHPVALGKRNNLERPQKGLIRTSTFGCETQAFLSRYKYQKEGG